MNIMLVSVTQRTPRNRRWKKHLARVAATSSSSFWRRRSPSLLWATPRHHPGLRGAFSVGRLTLYSAMAKHAEAGDIRLVINPSR